MDAKSYRNNFVQEAMPIVEKSVRTLQNTYDVIVLEGAGSQQKLT